MNGVLIKMMMAVGSAPAAGGGSAGGVGGWRPFLDPMHLGSAAWWWTLVPLAFGIAVVYKAVRVKTMKGYWKYTLMMAAQIVGAMVLIGVGVHVLVEWVAPWIE